MRLGQPDPGQRRAVPQAAVRGLLQLPAADRLHPLRGREEGAEQRRRSRRGLCRLLLRGLRNPSEGGHFLSILCGTCENLEPGVNKICFRKSPSKST